ncbi:hypothetical protein, partial [Xanthomonas euvesicatoria]|uniref:hypothetical protein n=1 Tax=Xanthomonas euvesicatoria TaxID=456327 RepID=UPI001C2086D7
MESRKSRSNHAALMRKHATVERKNDLCVSLPSHRKDKAQRYRCMRSKHSAATGKHRKLAAKAPLP